VKDTGKGAVGRSKECQPLHDRLSPLNHNTLDSVLLEKSEDLLRDIMGGVGRGRAGSDSNPDDNGAETALLLLSGRTVCCRVNSRPLDSVRLDDVENLGTNSVPDLVQRGTKDSVDRLDGYLAESANGLGEWCGESVGMVHEFRAATVPSNAVIIACSFIGVGTMLGNNGCLTGEVTGGGGAGQGGRARALVLQALEAGALKSEQGRLWTEGGKSDIDAEGSKRTH